MSQINDLPADARAADALRNYDPDYSVLSERSLRGYEPDMSGLRARLTPQIADTVPAGARLVPAAGPTIADVALRPSGAPVSAPGTGTSLSPNIRVGVAPPDVTDVVPRPAVGGSSAAAGPLESAAMSAIRRVAPALAAIPAAIDTGKVAADPNSSKTDVAVQAAEGAGRVGSTLAGAELGGVAGAALGGPAAPITGPIGALVGGVGGYYAGDQFIKGARSALGLGPSPIDRLAQQAMQPASQVQSPNADMGGPNFGVTDKGGWQEAQGIVPGPNGSTVQINPDGSAQLVSRPTVASPSAGAGRGQINPPPADPTQPAPPGVAAAAPTTVAGVSATRSPAAAPAANPFDGAVQIIRPGGQMTFAVQGPNGMVELDPGTYAAYQGAVAKNPALASRLQMTDAGPLVDGVSVPGNVFAAGDKAVNDYIGTINRAQTTGLSPAQQLTLREQNLTHMLPADTPLTANVGIGGGAPGGQALTGDAFLQTLPAPLQAQVKALAEGRQPFPAGPIMRTPYGQNLLNAVSQYDPSFDATNLPARSSLRKDAAAGKLASTNNAINTVLGHMGGLADQVDKLDTVSGFPGATLVNSAINSIEQSAGKTNVTNFNATRNSVAAELVKAWRASGGSVGDIQERLNDLNSAHTKEQLHQVLGTLADQLHSKLLANEDQWNRVMGPNGGAPKFLAPAAKASLQKIYQAARMPSPFAEGTGTPTPTAAAPSTSQSMPRKTIGDKTYENDGHGWYEVK